MQARTRRRGHLRTWSGAALTLVALAACGREAPPAAPVAPDPPVGEALAGSEDPPPDVASPTAAAPIDDSVIAAGVLAPVPPPIVTLLDAGTEPRVALRLAVTAGRSERASLSMAMRVDTAIDGVSAPPRGTPRGRLELEARTVAVSESGEATFLVTVEEASVDPEAVVDEGAVDPALAASMRAGLDAVRGSRAAGRVTDRGVTTLAAFEERAGLAPESATLLAGFRESLQQLAVPLPEEPVGPGARWQVEQLMSQGGMTVRQTTVFDLVAVDGDVVETRVSLAQVAAADDVEGALPAGGRLVAFAGSGTGEASLDLSRLLPRSSRARVQTQLRIEVPGPGGVSQEVVMAMDIDLAIGSGEVEALPE